MAIYRSKRIYDEPDESDGYRILIDRLWPRGVAKDKALFDRWLAEIAPSTELRNWFKHDPKKFDEFCARYHDELSRNPAVDELKALAKEHPVITLLYAARNTELNHARVLEKFLKSN